MKKFFIFLLTALGFGSQFYPQQNVIIVIVDGARYSETFGGGDVNIPHLYNDLKPAGTFYNNFYIQTQSPAVTSTIPGHTAVLTGNWEAIANDGTERPSNPTLFEYYRKYYSSAVESDVYLIGGKEKLDVLNYSNHSEYGEAYKASSEVTGLTNDVMVYEKLIDVMNTDQPRLILVNFTQTDLSAHSGNFDNYILAIHQADSLIYKLWQYIQSTSFYSNNTTLLITDDHGRHDDEHGGFQDHGDNCEGCRHIMLLALGPNINAGQEITDLRYQIDIAPTVGEVMSFPVPYSNGNSLFSGSNPLSVELSSFTAERKNESILIRWVTQSEIDNYGFEIQKLESKKNIWETVGFVKGNGNSNKINQYSFIDNNIADEIYFYKLKQIDNNGSFSFSRIIEVKKNFVDRNELAQNFPNPFNPSTKIKYSIPTYTKSPFTKGRETEQRLLVILKVYDILGNEVAALLNNEQLPGDYEVLFDAANLTAGVYFYRLQLGSFVSSKKMILLK